MLPKHGNIPSKDAGRGLEVVRSRKASDAKAAMSKNSSSPTKSPHTAPNGPRRGNNSGFILKGRSRRADETRKVKEELSAVMYETEVSIQSEAEDTPDSEDEQHSNQAATIPVTPVKIRSGLPGETTAGATPRRATAGNVPNNGRHKGRQLIRWTAASDQLLLLIVQYECYKKGVSIPWDTVARRFAFEKGPPTDKCMIQHLSKLRGHMFDSGRWVPPLMGRPQQKLMSRNEDVRGVVRYMQDGIVESRDIEWDEDVSHLVQPLDIETIPASRTPGGRKLFPDPDGHLTTRDPVTPSKPKLTPGAATRSTKRSGVTSARKPRSRFKIEKSTKEVDPVNLDSDEEYDPRKTKSVRRSARFPRAARSRAYSNLIEPNSSEDEDRKIGSASTENADSDDDDDGVSKLTFIKRRKLEKAHMAFNSEEEADRDNFLKQEKIIVLPAGPRLSMFPEGLGSDNIWKDDNAMDVSKALIGNESPPQFDITPTDVKTAGNLYDHPENRSTNDSTNNNSDDPFLTITTPFDDLISTEGGLAHKNVATAHPNGTLYPRALKRVIENYNKDILTAAQARTLWVQYFEDEETELGPAPDTEGGISMIPELKVDTNVMMPPSNNIDVSRQSVDSGVDMSPREPFSAHHLPSTVAQGQNYRDDNVLPQGFGISAHSTPSTTTTASYSGFYGNHGLNFDDHSSTNLQTSVGFAMNNMADMAFDGLGLESMADDTDMIFDRFDMVNFEADGDDADI